MRELNIEFQEQYKRLDKLCKEVYSSTEGVSAYIQDMENTHYDDRDIVNDWDIIYKELKHMRWMRNQLAHDISIDSEFCQQSDIDCIVNFRKKILSGNDPIAIVYKVKKQTQQQQKRQQSTTTISTKNKPRESIWHKIVSKIKSWFH